MNHLQLLFTSHPVLFGLVAVAFLVDITGMLTSIAPGAVAGLPSLFAIVYFLGLTSLIRFVVARRTVHLGITWPIMIVLYFGWFIAIAAVSDVQLYRPSLLVWICIFAAFKTLRFKESPPESGDLEQYESLGDTPRADLLPADVAAASNPMAAGDTTTSQIELKQNISSFSKNTRIFIAGSAAWIAWVIFRSYDDWEILGMYLYSWDQDMLFMNLILPIAVTWLAYQTYKWIAGAKT